MQALNGILDALPGGWSGPRNVAWSGRTGWASAFACQAAAEAAVGAAWLTAQSLADRRGTPLVPAPHWTGAQELDLLPGHLSRELLAADFSTVVFLDGQAPPLWADLSGYYATADERWVQLHCNFAHHASGVLEWLGLPAGTSRAVLAAELRERAADTIEAELVARGLIAAKLRTLAEWDAHPHARATRATPLVRCEQLAPAAPRDLETFRVLDLSRVLAGPVAGRTLAAIGADVLRVGAAHLPHVPAAVLTTGVGKRNTHLDLCRPKDRAQFEALLATANVLIDAYRPGALAALGYPAQRLAALSPGLALIEISAFDWPAPATGVWSARRGFDSIVQSTTGLVLEGAHQAARDQPTPLPVQLLDYATGYLAAAAAMALVHHQAQAGGTWRARLSLLATRNWLASLAAPTPFADTKPAWTLAQALPLCERFETEQGAMHLPRAAFGRPHLMEAAPQPLGSAPPVWL